MSVPAAIEPRDVALLSGLFDGDPAPDVALEALAAGDVSAHPGIGLLAELYLLDGHAPLPSAAPGRTA